jgi:uncharacterized membrane protein affecting hemolysin expression
MDQLRWRNWPLAVKLTMVTTLMVVMAVGSVTMLFTWREEATVRAEMQQQAELLLHTLTLSAADPLYNQDVESLQELMQTLGQDQTIVFGRVYDTTGRVLADVHDMTVAQHLQVDPFGQRLMESPTTVFEWQDDRFLTGKAVRIARQQLGAVSVGLSTAPLRANMNSLWA